MADFGDSDTAAFRAQGYFASLRVISPDEAQAIRGRLEAFEAARGRKIEKVLRFKTHLLFTWVDALVRHPTILDAMERLLGPDLLCLNTTFFIKEAHDPAFVSWHQDTTYLNLSAPDCITCWVALSSSTAESGCLQVVPGSHLLDQVPHRDTFAPDNMLSRGQEVAVDVDPATAVGLHLVPGEASLHHNRIFHGSAPNGSADRRIGIAISYIPTSVRFNGAVRSTAMLVRGRDAFGHFDPEPRPTTDLDPAALKLHGEITSHHVRNIYAGTDVRELRS